MRSPCAQMLRLLALIGVVTGFTACGSDNDELLTVEPPLYVRSITPDSGATNFVGSQDLSVTFDRAPGVGNVIMELFPMPTVVGSYGPTGSGRNWTWFDVECEAADGGYAWLIDGFLMPEPLVIHFASGDRLQLTGFAGAVLSSDPAQVTPDGAVVFALADDAGFNPLDPSTFLTARAGAQSVTLARRLDALRPDLAQHQFFFMEKDRSSVVVAIKDTNNDLVYDPRSDWWGFYRTGNGSEIAIAFSEFWQDEEYNLDVTITLGPPASR